MKQDLNRVLINEISKGSIPFSAAGPSQAANMQENSTWMEKKPSSGWLGTLVITSVSLSVYPKKYINK